MRPRLIPDWKQAHRFASVRVLAGGIVAGIVAATTVYFNLHDAAPVLVTIGLAVLVFLLAIVARIWQQRARVPARRDPSET